MRKLLLIFCILFTSFSHASDIVNVEYIHDAISRRWGVTVPYNSALSTPKVAANMEYLLTAIDRTNAILNGAPITEYGVSEYATHAAADTIATNDAVADLVHFNPKFTITTTADTSNFTFNMSAMGRFFVDWGDGTAQEIRRQDTLSATYSHTYRVAGVYKIGMTGAATGYDKSNDSAISFAGNKNIAAIDGSLGAIFSTIGDGIAVGAQPRFGYTFGGCSNLAGEIPADLFSGVHGRPILHMFFGTFSGCRRLSGSIPENLFAGISGAPAYGVFRETFASCSGLTGPIPANLFAGISGAPASYMFDHTFSSCSGLSGPIPDTLFAGISGAPASYMFANTFALCAGIDGAIPSVLFAGVHGAPAESMFSSTFFACGGLTGAIPENLFAGVSGAPASGMFASTFSNASGLTGPIPANLFAGISGPLAESMFATTFYNCAGLTGPSARINGKYLYEIWENATATEVGACYTGASGLSDWAEIPDAWK